MPSSGYASNVYKTLTRVLVDLYFHAHTILGGAGRPQGPRPFAAAAPQEVLSAPFVRPGERPQGIDGAAAQRTTAPPRAEPQAAGFTSARLTERPGEDDKGTNGFNFTALFAHIFLSSESQALNA